MATRPIVPAGIEIVVNGSANGSIRRTVLHASASGTHPTLAELTSAANIVRDKFVSPSLYMANNVTLESVTATDISVAGGQSYTSVYNPPHTGDRQGAPLPSNVAAVVSIGTTRGGKSGHGRIYWYGLTTGDIISGDTIDPGYRTAVVGVVNGIAADMEGAGLPMCVFSRKLLVLSPWQSVKMDPYVDSQRRRLIGRGR